MVKLMRYFFLFVFLRVIFTRDDMNLFALVLVSSLVDHLDAKTQLWLPP